MEPNVTITKYNIAVAVWDGDIITITNTTENMLQINHTNFSKSIPVRCSSVEFEVQLIVYPSQRLVFHTT